jgi:lactoylglutathione lyase
MIRFIFALAVLGCGPVLRAEDTVRNFRITSLYHVGYWVRDIGKVRDFYGKYLGFEEPYVLNYPDGKLQLVIMKVSERQVIYLFPDASKIRPNGENLDHLGLLVVPDAAKAFATLTARSQSGEFPAPAPLSTTRDGKRQTSVVDPDGTRVILSE